MPDHRTRRQKLEAMANHPRSDPNEAAVARAMIDNSKPEPAVSVRLGRRAVTFNEYWAREMSVGLNVRFRIYTDDGDVIVEEF